MVRRRARSIASPAQTTGSSHSISAAAATDSGYPSTFTLRRTGRFTVSVQVRKLASRVVLLVALTSFTTWPAPVQAQDDPAGEVRSLAFVALPSTIAATQLDVRTMLTSMAGVLAAGSDLRLGLGAGFAIGVAGTVRESQTRGETGQTGQIDGGVSYRWSRAQRISELYLGYQHPVNTGSSGLVRSRMGLRSTGSSWATASAELEIGDAVAAAVSAAVALERGPVVPVVEAKLGRGEETFAMGSFGARVRLPSSFEVGLAVVAAVTPSGSIGMTLSVGWRSQLSGINTTRGTP